MFQPRELERITKKIVEQIEDDLNRVGLFYRIFSRVKTTESIKNKISRKGEDYYEKGNKLIRDIIGVRIIFYFSDDVEVIYERLKKKFAFVEETVDRNEETKFAPTRINIILKVPEGDQKEFNDIANHFLVDSTFEIQLRTILSEGWHEIDHDLRYKCQKDWIDNSDLARNFNGILAALESNEYATLRLFDQLSHRHYKFKDINAMIRTKFRLRFSTTEISDELKPLINDGVLKQIFKTERVDLINYILKRNIITPLTLDNVIYIINFGFINDRTILKNTPQQLIKDLGD